MRGETFYREQRKNGGGGQYFLRCAQIDILGLVEGAVFSVNACVISEGVVKFNYNAAETPGYVWQKDGRNPSKWLNILFCLCLHLPVFESVPVDHHRQIRWVGSARRVSD